MISNLWNERMRRAGATRMPDPSRPWYRYGAALLQAEGLLRSGERKILDVGCGVGEFMVLLRKMGFEVEGVDGNEEYMKRVRLLGFPGRMGDLESGLPFPDGSFSVVTCLEVVEHITRAETLLEEIHRVLQPGGHLLLTTPNFSYLHNRLHYLLGKGPLNEGIHLRYFTRDRLLSILKDTRFEVVAKNSYGPIPLWSSLAIRLLRRECPLWPVPGWLEGFLAYDFIYLVAKR